MEEQATYTTTRGMTAAQWRNFLDALLEKTPQLLKILISDATQERVTRVADDVMIAKDAVMQAVDDAAQAISEIVASVVVYGEPVQQSLTRSVSQPDSEAMMKARAMLMDALRQAQTFEPKEG